jgi:hypothetical protein
MQIQYSRVRPLSFTGIASSTQLRFVDEHAIRVNESFSFLTLTVNNYSKPQTLFYSETVANIFVKICTCTLSIATLYCRVKIKCIYSQMLRLINPFLIVFE